MSSSEKHITVSVVMQRNLSWQSHTVFYPGGHDANSVHTAPSCVLPAQISHLARCNAGKLRCTARINLKLLEHHDKYQPEGRTKDAAWSLTALKDMYDVCGPGPFF